jgi:AcrR family transcriptional regulator
VPDRPHDRILATATRLFLQEGIGAVSMSRIAAEAGVALMTIYRQFGNKDLLAAAVVRDWSAGRLRRLANRLDRPGGGAETSLRGLWGVLEEWMATEELPGSLGTSVAIELRGRAWHPAHDAIEDDRVALRRLLEDLARREGAVDPPRLAAQLQFLVESALAAGVTDRGPAAPEDVRALADAAFLADSAR